MKDGIKILSIGNSFSEDTMEHIPEIVKSLGYKDFKFANLYIGGCSIKKHYNLMVNDIAEYEYYVNSGDGWTQTQHFTSREKIKEEDWDIISIQHGTGDKSRYTSPESYADLPALIKEVKALSKKDVKIAFNMAWVAEPEGRHHEITSYGGDQALMYKNITIVTKEVVSPLVDVVSSAGTAIQNARPYIDKKLTRDTFHVTRDLGRYIAGLTFIKALCGTDIDSVTWCSEGVSDEERVIAIKAANAAVKEPYKTTEL